MKKTIRYPKVLLAGLALCLAAGAWWAAAGHPGRSGGKSARAAASIATPSDILAAIPRPAGSSATDLAIVKWTAKAQEKGSDARTWINLGDALMQHVRETADTAYYGHAERAYKQALVLQPRSDEAMTGLAWVHGGRHQFPQSIEWANKAIALNERNHLAYGLLGDANVEMGDYADAFAHYQKMMDIRPDISSYSRGAHLLHITGQTSRAAWLMREAIKSGAAYAENTAWCRAQLALIYFSDGNVVAAEQVLTDALEKNPNNRHVLAALGRVKAAQKEYRAAIGFYKKAVEAVPEHDTLVALGDLYAVTGDNAEAEKQYTKVEELHRRDHGAGDTSHDLPMAQFYADHDRNLVEALRLAEQRKLTNNVFEADILAWCYHKNRQPEQAKQAIARALSQKTPDAKILYHAGMIYAAAGERPAAQQYLYQALSLNPSFSPIHAVIATDTLKKLGQVAAGKGGGTNAPAGARGAAR